MARKAKMYILDPRITFMAAKFKRSGSEVAKMLFCRGEMCRIFHVLDTFYPINQKKFH